MQRHLPLVLLLIAAMALPAAAAPHTKRRPASRNDTVSCPAIVRPMWSSMRTGSIYWRRHPSYWYGWPGWYRGRWNGGGFGPCWTQTPIGNVWNCGR